MNNEIRNTFTENVPPPIPNKSKTIWQVKADIVATISFYISLAILSGIFFWVNNSQDKIVGKLEFWVDNITRGILLLALVSFIVSVILSIWLIAIKTVEKWKSIALLCADFAWLFILIVTQILFPVVTLWGHH